MMAANSLQNSSVRKAARHTSGIFSSVDVPFLKEEEISNYNESIMLPKAAISERGSFRET